MAADSAAGTLYVADLVADRVSVINVATSTVVSRVRVRGAIEAAVDPTRHTAYVTSDLPDSVCVVQPCRCPAESPGDGSRAACPPGEAAAKPAGRAGTQLVMIACLTPSRRRRG